MIADDCGLHLVANPIFSRSTTLFLIKNYAKERFTIEPRATIVQHDLCGALFHPTAFVPGVPVIMVQL